MARNIPKAYEPQQIESRWARAWVEEKLFHADAKAPGPVFSIVIPPPNVTGSIHIGHMLEHTEIDILVRWQRMRGHRTLWLPGTDHAGIATQVVVERELAKQGLTRQQLGREEFERRVWEWKASSGDTIKKQMTRLGASCDWSRERFTLDPPLYRAVLEAFLRLYREGLIYRGRYMVNWCPRCQTALSDLETVHQEHQGHLWYIRYPVIGSDGSLVVATTRPETLLGDTGVAVHPEDDRYAHLVGKKARLPLMEREIPVVADAYVDREFGTGVVKITPAHDANDFEAARRHGLPEIDILTDDGRMSAAAGEYVGLERFEARKKVVEDLKARGLLERVVNHTYAVGTCQRCKTVVEPRASTQWFCKMKPLAAPAIQVVQDGLIPIVPENQKKIYLDWLANIRDWCISRQLWWGHRIPIWHCADCQAETPARDSRVEVINGRAQAASAPKKCSACGSENITQDPDVLDTWFSSALWPFSTLGWPDETEDLRVFYPTSLLISGYDILFFWDARMIMMGLHLVDRPKIEQRIPFRVLYLHSLVRDPQGLKMSKTRGNVVDPLEIIEQHGTDALRFTLAIMAAPGTDISLSEERILSYRAFANKIWNAARFLFVNLDRYEQQSGENISQLMLREFPWPGSGEPFPPPAETADRWQRLWPQHHDIADQWIYAQFMDTVDAINGALQEFRFHEAAQKIYHFFWHDLCDWYIEWVKPKLFSSAGEPNKVAFRNLANVFEESLRLLHPFMPFLTEELWQRFPHKYASIALAPYPQPWKRTLYEGGRTDMGLVKEIVVAVRNIRAELKLDPRRKVMAEFATSDPALRKLVMANREPILRLATLSELRIVEGHLNPAGGPVRSNAIFDLRIPFAAAVDVRAEVNRLRKEKEKLARDLEAKQSRLADEAFRSRAPADVVRSLETTLQERQREYEKLVARLAQMEKSLGATEGTDAAAT